MARLLKKAGDFVLDVAAQQYKRSMTRKLNAFGEQAGMQELGVLGVVVRDCTHEATRTHRLLLAEPAAAGARNPPQCP